MKLKRKLDKILVLVTVFVLSLVFGAMWMRNQHVTYAQSEDGIYVESDEHFVTFYDNGQKLTVKTTANTVSMALERAGIVVDPADIVDPGLDTEINSNNFFVNIYRSHPAIIRDGISERYLMTASYDPYTIATQAGFTIYDGDEVAISKNTNFLETGVANVYEITRNGGRTVTVEEEIAFTETEVKDYNLESGAREVRQLGEVGTKRISYNVYYIDNQEVSREVVSEEIVRQPVERIVAVGAKPSLPPNSDTCADWARQAGVSEADLPSALDLIYHESGCRVDAMNASSGAYGIPQALPGNKMATVGADWETNPVTQIKWMAGYVNKYGGWQGALAWWYAHGWY
ncbi:G5 domain-containing protein [Candidatus Saccharibacteria bacterium]|nr:G5 domain-containing protein [Candidatus Saccharibacteria bacterium]